MAPAEPSNADIFAALGQLVTTVGSLAESVAQLADHGSGPAPEPLPLPVFSNEPDFAPLAPLDADNVERRTRLAADLGILGEPAGAELVQWGARGFYRKLERNDGQERIHMRRDLAVRLVQDAESEDLAEAQAMSRDLLAFWDDIDEADHLPPPPLD